MQFTLFERIFEMVSSLLLLLLVSVCCVHCNETSTCTPKEIRSAYLDTASEFITKAKTNSSTDNECTLCMKDCPKCRKIFDCADVLNAGHNTSGVYEIWLLNRVIEVNKPLAVYCDMDTDGGGWTVIQRRGDFGSPKDYFFRDWKSYKEGFGEVEKDFWLGNDNIFALTNQKRYSVRFDLMDVEKNKRYAHYDDFWISGPFYNYALHIYNYSGDAGDAMEYHNKLPFSTKDRVWFNMCAEVRKGAWWYKACNSCNPNGLYHKGKYEGPATDGITWIPWKGAKESLEWTEIKVRPNDFRAARDI